MNRCGKTDNVTSDAHQTVLKLAEDSGPKVVLVR